MLQNLRAYDDISYVRVATLATTALVARRQGDMAATHDLLERALDSAEPERLRRPFCEDHLEMRQLLAEHLAWGTRHEDFLMGCLTLREPTGPLESLSDREREVLDQLRTTRTMTEIAQALSVSINTVKSHQRAIYRKLGVTSRREAVRLFT
jgi:LuxR family maltose regulon positive regulatory protein